MTLSFPALGLLEKVLSVLSLDGTPRFALGMGLVPGLVPLALRWAASASVASEEAAFACRLLHLVLVSLPSLGIGLELGGTTCLTCWMKLTTPPSILTLTPPLPASEG